MKPEELLKACAAVEAELADQGKIVAGGFAGFRLMVLPKDAPKQQVDEMRMAFFAGSHHLFTTIMRVLDHTSKEPTQRDLDRIELVHKELEDFRNNFELKHMPVQGRG